MHLSRRKMITAAATGATAAGVTLVSALPASAAPRRRYRTRPSPRMRRQPTDYDRSRKQQNPANSLGCPLGRGF
ncbi:hypothetical protein HNR11_002588 [Nesterenkonia sandarakina]|uniref:Secreted protein n=1 Tax=Nesterenkonia sandarakina TaxID=272918 RepID=A0A7Z0EAL2_9MICC|nr:hypothetical protein [Nesterenkonia sandarakina]